MAISKLLSIEDCWSVDKFIRNSAIQNVMTKTRFKAIIQDLYFANNEVQNTKDKYQLIFSTGYFQKVLEIVKTSPDEQTYRFKGKSSLKQYIKTKPVKWGFKFWHRYESDIGYVYHLDIYQASRNTAELNFWEKVVLDLCKELKNAYCLNPLMPGGKKKVTHT